MLDTHIHSKHSHDGTPELSQIVAQAKSLGLTYIATTEHLDLDYLFGDIIPRKQLDIDAYLVDHRATRCDSALTLAFGIETGYSPESVELNKSILPKYPFDVIINSVHSLNNVDLYYLLPRINIENKNEIYLSYLEAVLGSTNPGYDYDVIAHLGYVARYVNYANKELYYNDTADIIDAILKNIIALDKTLEINTNVKTLPWVTLPEPAIIKRYAELGGTNISFASDAHTIDRICFNYDSAKEIVLSFGFKYWTSYVQRAQIKTKI
ncbi:MAG: histidinol-phosphatase HisJ family protein [Christensenellaceae bacterium]|jgi:histidinol-phosphatase (PHP family)|nr:histidinol-phosphatase HisJ family protein [Christensenellaceae bacterium]